MQNNNFIKSAKNFKLALAAVLIALVGVQAFNLSNIRSFAAPRARPAQTAELKSATEAKKTLARLGSPNFAKIKDTRKRDAMQNSYNAIKALADNSSAGRESALFASLDRATKTLKALPRPKKTKSFEQDCDNRYSTCMELCGASGGHGNCDICAGANNMCYTLGIFKEFVDGSDVP